MSKLHAQMALLGTIDDVVRNSSNPDTVKMVESFLPGTTGVGQQGWYRELKHFLNRKELLPRDAAGGIIERDGPVTFPGYTAALNELSAGDKPTRPDVKSRSLFAATILSIAGDMEGGQLPPFQGYEPTEGAPDPLDVLMPAVTRKVNGSMPRVAGIAESEPLSEPLAALKSTLRTLRSREDYLNLTQGLVRSGVLDPVANDVMKRPVVCTGALRRVDGQFSTLLTTCWDTPFKLSKLREIIDPLNWPDLCDFFVSMTPQTPLNPDFSQGWSRVLESVSGDETQWEMRTALRYWKGVSTDGEGIYINYDLDNPRVNDAKLVEVDAGYIWATPLTPGDPDSLVKLRTCKQVRIRGVSPTATAALGCGFGWGDSMSQMFVEGVDDPPENPKVFAASQPQPVVITSSSPADAQRPADESSDEGIAEAAEEVELIKGWRGAIIKAMQLQLTNGIERAQSLGTDFAVRWSDGDGLSLEDVKEFGARYGTEMTEYAVGMFKDAAAALQPQSDDVNATGGND